MTGYVLDCCTLLNLYCGWGGLRHLHAMDGPFHIGTAVAAEALYAQEYETDGAVARRKLDIRELYRQYPLVRISLGTAQEKAMMVRLAGFLDDGEAEGLALAFIRGHAFCSDDGAVGKVVQREQLQVRVVSTPELLQRWAAEDPQRISALPGIVRRATELARFMPHSSSPHLEWWRTLACNPQPPELPET